MTCREFKDFAGSLSLPELSQKTNPTLLEHAGACGDCSTWLEQRQRLNGMFGALKVRTAGAEASPSVENALLMAFRQQMYAAAPEPAPSRFAPLALWLSRLFEFGAYAAVAAAILLAMFLGANFLRHRPSVAQRNSAPIQQGMPQASAVAASDRSQTEPEQAATQPVETASSSPRHVRASESRVAEQAVTQTASLREQGYTDLMLCDPLSCSGDAQVVSVQLPGQSQVADLVVGDDGVVRAVRIEN